MISYRVKHYLNFVWEEISTIISLIIVFLIGILLIYSIYNYQNTKATVNKTRLEIAQTKSRVEILKKSKALVEKELDETNKLLSILIPDTEDYFSIIYALESISKQTGFIIDDYVLSLIKSSEKLSVTVNGSGNIESFMNFLKNYSFAGGRFITSEKVEFSNSTSSGTKILLNFYSKQIDIDNQVIPELTQRDIDFLKKIKDKISINLIGDKEKLDEDYPTKTNPF